MAATMATPISQFKNVGKFACLTQMRTGAQAQRAEGRGIMHRRGAEDAESGTKQWIFETGSFHPLRPPRLCGVTALFHSRFIPASLRLCVFALISWQIFGAAAESPAIRLERIYREAGARFRKSNG